MNRTPAVSMPRHPARSCPMLMATSVEVGPGSRLAAPNRSRESVFGQPRSSARELLPEQRDMGRGTAERGETESAEHPRKLAKAPWILPTGRRSGVSHGCKPMKPRSMTGAPQRGGSLPVETRWPGIPRARMGTSGLIPRAAIDRIFGAGRFAWINAMSTVCQRDQGASCVSDAGVSRG